MMRQFVLIAICFLGLYSGAWAQDSLIIREVNFENQDYEGLILLDSSSNWQIASLANKWGNGFFGPYGILTDSILPYKPQTISSFLLKVPTSYRDTSSAWRYNVKHLTFGFYYKLDIDTTNDFGLVYLSLNKGVNWKNISNYSQISGSFPDTFRINKSGWTGVSYNLSKLYSDSFELGDTLWISFEFLSHENPDNRKGWAVDAIQIQDYLYSVGLERFSPSISMFIDENSNLIISPLREVGNLDIYSSSGTLVKSVILEKDEYSTIPVHLPSGCYFFSLTTQLNRVSKLFCIE